MKRIATVQDISCLGKCSLTVALPVISAMGVEASVVPTAVLSTHTMFSRCYKRDLTEDIPEILNHWEEEEFRFDAIYTGYLGSKEQIALAMDLFHKFRTEDNLMIVDPVMGDHGRLYDGFDEDFAAAMTDLCGMADMILPNMTEACVLLGMEYDENYDRATVQMMLKKLTAQGARAALLTGLSFEEGTVGIMGYDSRTGEFFEHFGERIAATYHGTGDLFAAAFVGGLMRGLSLPRALAVAADFTRECIRVTVEEGDGAAYGVKFEKVIPWLVRRLEAETAE